MMNIDHSNIPASDLSIALSNATLDPDGQVFPWRPGYPLIGGTVYHDGQLWTVAGREREVGVRGATRETDIGMVKLVGQGHDGQATATRGELRPITWTQRDEDWRHIA